MIRPGLIWPDDRGRHIQAHGGGIIKCGGTWYWFGEDRSRENDPAKRYVACYSSSDLANWTFRNQILALSAPEGFGTDWVLERPKVFPCSETGKFVLYMHIDGCSEETASSYGIARIAVAVCDTIDGDYQYLRSFRPLGLERNCQQHRLHRVSKAIVTSALRLVVTETNGSRSASLAGFRAYSEAGDYPDPWSAV